MTKMRVYEYAKEKNVSSKDVINKLKEMNIEVSNHMTALDDSTVNKLNDSLNKKQENTPADSTISQPASKVVEKYEEEANEKGTGTASKEKLKKKPPVKPVAAGSKPFNKGGRGNNRNRNNVKHKPSHSPQAAPVQKRKERELPTKISFTE